MLNEGGGCDCCKEVELFYEGECAAGSHVGRPTGLGEASLVLFRARRNTLGSKRAAWTAQVAPAGKGGGWEEGLTLFDSS